MQCGIKQKWKEIFREIYDTMMERWQAARAKNIPLSGI